MKIMVVGAYGNLGSAICQNSDHITIPVGRKEWEAIQENSFENVDVIIHAASDLYTPINQFPTSVICSEMIVTCKLLEYARDQGVKKFIYISSCAVYGNSLPIENTACNPVTFNGHIKLINEQIVEGFCNHNAINWNALRVFNMYGGKDKFSIVSKLLHSIKYAKTATLKNNGLGVRDFIHVKDVAKIILRLIEKNSDNICINIGTGQATQISKLIDIIEAAGASINVERVDTPDLINSSVANLDRLEQYIGRSDLINIHEYLKHKVLSLN